mgnify:CR=1 FL=1
MIDINKLKIKIFADGADINGISELNKKKFIKGFTTNPSLMRKSGVEDYKKFAFEVLKIVNDKPVSFEVFADDINQMEEQAYEIASWGKNANVKIPITNTKGDSTVQLIKKLSNSGVICNVTAIFTTEQLNSVVEVLKSDTPAILSVFAGRIADSGIDPMSIMQQSVKISKKKNKSSVLWASTREIINIFQAENAGCQIITVPNNILKKIPGIGKDLKENSLDTVSMFYKDALAAGYKIDVKK